MAHGLHQRDLNHTAVCGIWHLVCQPGAKGGRGARKGIELHLKNIAQDFSKLKNISEKIYICQKIQKEPRDTIQKEKTKPEKDC